MPGDIVFALGALVMAYDFVIKIKAFMPKTATLQRPAHAKE